MWPEILEIQTRICITEFVVVDIAGVRRAYPRVRRAYARGRVCAARMLVAAPTRAPMLEAAPPRAETVPDVIFCSKSARSARSRRASTFFQLLTLGLNFYLFGGGKHTKKHRISMKNGPKLSIFRCSRH